MTRPALRRMPVLAIALLAVALLPSSAAALKANSVRSKHIKNGQVRSADLAKRAVTAAKVKAGAIGSAQLADGGVKGADLDEASLDFGVVQRRIAGACALGTAIRAVTIDGGLTCEPVGAASPATATGPAGGALSGTYPNPEIGEGKVTTVNLADAIVTAAKLAAGAVTSEKLADGAVTSGKLGLPISRTDALAGPALSLANDGQPDSLASFQDQSVLSVRRTHPNSTGPAIYAATNSIFANFGTAAVAGESQGAGGVGVLAYASSTSGNGAALQAISKGGGNGITANSQTGHAIEATSNDGDHNGVYGWQPSFSTGTAGAGVRAASFSANGTGLRATANGSGGVPLRATAGGSATTAAVFTGNVQVNGTLSKSAGSFRIDHPLHPRTRYLSHSFVESPDMKNIYDGVVRTDGRGFATVRMPSWFDALNRSFRYQLTVVGRSFAKAIVWQELRDGRFVIRTDEPHVKVSWQVTGIRDDAYARARRIPVETRKRGRERGRFLYPQGFGASASRQIGR